MASAPNSHAQVGVSGDDEITTATLRQEEHCTAEQAGSYVKYPLDVLYCGVCSFPLEFCEFSDDFGRCKQWMRENAAEMFERLVDQATDGMEGTSLNDETKGTSKVKKPVKKRVRFENTKIVKVGFAVRGKKKTVTMVTGLGAFGVDVKKASRMFAQHFSCGSSVNSDDEIVVQGDIVDDVIVFIRKKFVQVTRDVIKDVGEWKR